MAAPGGGPTFTQTTDGALEIVYRGVGGVSLAGWMAVFCWIGIGVTLFLEPWDEVRRSLQYWAGVAVTIAMTYAALAIQCNATRIRLDRDHLTWSRGPIPTVGGGRQVRHRAQIIDVTVDRVKAPEPTGRGAKRRQVGGLSDSFRVIARTREGGDAALLFVNDRLGAESVAVRLNERLDALRVRGGKATGVS